MSLVDPLLPTDTKNDHNHAAIMNDFFAATASDEAYRPGARANHSYSPSHSRSRSANSRTSQRSAADDMTAQLPMASQDTSSLGLQPPAFSQTHHSKHSNTYQDTQMFQSFPSSANPMSPSISSYHEQATPETWLSDHGCTDISQYTTPGFDDDFPMGLLTVEGANDISFPNYAMVSHDSSGPSSSVNVSSNNLQAPVFPAGYGGSHLMSPSLTSHSSPGSSTECLTNPTTLVSAPSLNNSVVSKSLTPAVEADHLRGASAPEQQRSPALTGSPGENYLDVPQDRSAQFTSPVVRIENFSRDDSPARSGVDRSLSKRSATHLSPHDAEESSDEEGGRTFVHDVPIRTVPAPQRGDDGSWIRSNDSGHAGINPEERKAMQDQHIPTLKEQEDMRLLEEKNQDVEEWLTRSEVGSEAGDPDGHPRRKKQPGRRRARSTNDIMSRKATGLGVRFPAFNVPGPGLNINVESENEESEETDEEEDETKTPASPPARVEINHVGDEDSYFPQIPHAAEEEQSLPHVRPWRDVPQPAGVPDGKYQPDTSNAAMMKFRQRAKDLETASLAATLGSHRRRSESEIGSLWHASGISKAVGPDADTGKVKEKRGRKNSLLENLRRSPSNLLKRKGSHPSHPSQQTAASASPPTLALETKINVPPKRSGSWSRTKSPKPDTSPVTKENGSSSNLAPSGTGPLAYAKNVIRRSRSRSDIGSRTPGLSELMRTHGGPPTLSLVTPANDPDATNPSPRGAEGSGDDEDADFDDVGQESVTMNLKVRSDPIIPTIEGFREHARLLNPRLDEYMIERVAQEQNRRYKKLLDMKVKHLKAIRGKSCGSKGFCTALGGESKILPPRGNNKEGEAPFAGFQIVVSSEDEIDPAEEGTIIPKTLPAGFPIPPVKRMPAEFECPLCFKVKKFFKPSDWTKHVYEDLQPFTCTFPNCGEPMSFKRKADWVRHENERHRQLESWVCSRQGCGHICYRKDNFVQHLVREHKVPEPKARTGRAAHTTTNASFNTYAWSLGEDVFTGAGDPSDKVWALVEACRQDTPKQPKNEPCRFCGNICPSWKKLTVHLAKHLEQISLPILPLVDHKQLNADTIISPVEKQQPHRARATSSAAPPGSSNGAGYGQGFSATNLSNTAGSSYSSFPTDAPASATSNVMHTYPPPQVQNYRPQPPQQAQAANYQVDMTSGFAVRSYPGLQAANGAAGQSRLDPNQYAANGYPPPITPVTDYAQSGQVFQSPVEAAPFGNDLPPSLYAYNGGVGAEFSAGLGNMQFQQVNGGGQFAQGQYQQMPSSYPRQQQGYPYQG